MPSTTPQDDDQAHASSFFDGPAAPYQPFLNVRGPDAPTAPKPDINRFLQLPAEAIVGGLVHTRGRASRRPRLDAAVLSVLAWHWQRSRGRAEALTYHDGVTVDIGPDEFVLSVLSVAAVLWLRFRRAPVPVAVLSDKAFWAYYERVRLAVARLCDTVVGGTPLLTHLGPAREDVEGKAADAYGQRWSMTGSVVDRLVENLPPCGSQEVLFPADLDLFYGSFQLEGQEGLYIGLGKGPLDNPGEMPDCDSIYVQEYPLVGPVVDVARALDALFVRDLGLYDRFTEAAAKTGRLVRKERGVHALGWQRQKARGLGWGGAHITIGSWQTGQATSPDRRARPCAVPFLVADVDGASPDQSLGIVRTLLERLVELGAQPGDLVVSYTGGRGYHIRIPHGLVGHPVYPNTEVARRTVGAFFGRLCDGLKGPDGPLVDSVDSSLFSPVHLVRAVGSEYEKAPERRCVAYRGGTFLELCRTYGHDVTDIVTMQSRSPKPVQFFFPDPDRTSAVPVLEAMMRAAAADAQTEVAREAESPNTVTAPRRIIAAIRRGVRPGEEFFPNYVGRAYAALLLADYLLTHGRLDERAAWAELERWNAANPVPIGEAEGDTDGELERVFDRACRYVSGRPRGGVSGAS
ncbi:MAG TPA: hypothetical protein VGB53_16970 [Rubricoccaceae bacterium]|jgi:hypothetical protein